MDRSLLIEALKAVAEFANELAAELDSMTVQSVRGETAQRLTEDEATEWGIDQCETLEYLAGVAVAAARGERKDH